MCVGTGRGAVCHLNGLFGHLHGTPLAAAVQQQSNLSLKAVLYGGCLLYLFQGYFLAGRGRQPLVLLWLGAVVISATDSAPHGAPALCTSFLLLRFEYFALLV